MKLLKDANGYTVEYDPEHGTTWLRGKDITIAFQNSHVTVFNDHSYTEIKVRERRTDSGWQSNLVLRSEPKPETPVGHCHACRELLTEGWQQINGTAYCRSCVAARRLWHRQAKEESR